MISTYILIYVLFIFIVTRLSLNFLFLSYLSSSSFLFENYLYYAVYNIFISWCTWSCLYCVHQMPPHSNSKMSFWVPINIPSMWTHPNLIIARKFINLILSHTNSRYSSWTNLIIGKMRYNSKPATTYKRKT